MFPLRTRLIEKDRYLCTLYTATHSPMQQYIQRTHEEIKLGFVASCIEFVAYALNRPYQEVYLRMDEAGILNYIYKHYNVIHTQSRDHVTEDLITMLQREEVKA